jgi:hypothetical protein
LHGPAGASQRSSDFPDRPAGGFELCNLDGSFWHRRFLDVKVESRSDLIPILWPESAIPAGTGAGLFGPEGKCQAGQAGWASGAAGDEQVVWVSVVGVEKVGVHSAACGTAELTFDGPAVGVIDQVAEFAFVSSEEEMVTHGCCLQLSTGGPAAESGSG